MSFPIQITHGKRRRALLLFEIEDTPFESPSALASPPDLIATFAGRVHAVTLKIKMRFTSRSSSHDLGRDVPSGLETEPFPLPGAPATRATSNANRPNARGIRDCKIDRLATTRSSCSRLGTGQDRESESSGQKSSPSAFGHCGFTGTALWIDPEQKMFVIVLSNRVHPDKKGSVNSLGRRIGTISAAAIKE